MVSVLHRGQITIEFLLLLAILLAFLAAWLPLIVSTQKNTERMITNLSISKALNEIIGVANELCILGDENVRGLRLFFINEVSISANNYEIIINERSENISCEISIEEKRIKYGVLTLENKNGKIFGSFT